MPTLYNHGSHLNASDYESHNPEKAEYMRYEGGLYTARAIPCTSPDDVIQLDPRLKNDYPYMLEHLEEVGLDTAEQVIWDASAEIAEELPDYDLSVWLFNEDFNRVRPNNSRLQATRKFNDKNSFIRHCNDQGYPVPRTTMVDDGVTLDISPVNFPVYLKAARSSDGASIYRCKSNQELTAITEQADYAFQIQEEVEGVSAFLNVQYRSVGGEALYLATTEQILDGFSHAGNRHPSEHDPRNIIHELANDIASEGVDDIFALDVAISPAGAHVIECNARWNGSTYPSMVAQKLAAKEWVACSVGTSLASAKDIKLGDITYNPSESIGVVILNAGHMAMHGKVSVMFIGPEDAQQEQKIKLSKILGGPGELEAPTLIAA